MKKANALQIRQNLGAILKLLKKDGKPILVEKDRQPQAVLISLEDYRKRFVDVDADAKRKDLIEFIKAAEIEVDKGQDGVTLVRSVRESRS